MSPLRKLSSLFLPLGALLLAGCGDSSESSLGERTTSAAGAAGAGQAGAGAAGAGGSGQGGSGQGGSGQGGSGGTAGAGGEAGGAGGGEAGQGGAGASGGSGQGGAAGASGGAPQVPCGLLQVAGDPIGLSAGDSTALRFPRLASVDGEAVAVGGGFQAIGIPAGTLPIGYATIKPWETWPLDPPTLAQITFGGASAYELAGGEGSLWLLSATGAEVQGKGLTALRLLGGAPPGDLVQVDALALRPAFFSLSGGALLAAGDLGGLLRAARVEGDKAEALTPSLGCASQGMPLWAGAARLPGGADLLMATSRNPPPVCDQFENVPQGSPRRILLYRRDGQELTLLQDKDEGVAVTFAGLVPRSDGAWLVYQLGDGVTSGPVVAERLGADGAPTGQSAEVFPGGMIFSPLALAPLGDRLAVVWSDDLGQVTKLLAKVVGDDGQTPPVLFSNDFAPERRVLGSPDGKSLLIAWETSDGASSSTIRLLRIDCAPEAQ